MTLFGSATKHNYLSGWGKATCPN